jgi:hypothetical protein
MVRLLRFFARWRVARSAALHSRIRRIVGKGPFTVE